MKIVITLAEINKQYTGLVESSILSNDKVDSLLLTHISSYFPTVKTLTEAKALYAEMNVYLDKCYQDNDFEFDYEMLSHKLDTSNEERNYSLDEVVLTIDIIAIGKDEFLLDNE